MEKVCTLNNPSASPPPPSYSHTSSPYSSNESVLSPASEDLPPFPPSSNFDQDWEMLSDILIEDALSGLPPASLIVSSNQHSAHNLQNVALNASSRQTPSTPASPFSKAVPADYSSSSSVCSVADATCVASRPGVKSAGVRNIANGRARGKKFDNTSMKKEAPSLIEQKKQRRRSQIASSVQRHREKKKYLVSALRAEMTSLSQQVMALRANRRAQLDDNDQLVTYQEEAMTQRRKRKQAEHTHQQLKQALFQQTSFLNGMRSLMETNNMPDFKTLEFHDWVHSYTALNSKDALTRRKEYVAHFPKSKMDLATNLVLKNTELETQRLLATCQMYMSKVRLLHDGTRNAQTLDDGLTDVTMRELLTSNIGTTDEAGDGRVVKEFTSVFLFQKTTQCTLETLVDLVLTSMRSIGVYYPGAMYQSRAVDEVVHHEADGVTQSCIYYTNLVASMQPVFEVVEDAHEIKVEARVITREQRGPDGGMILWDYVDDDFSHPLPVDNADRKTICRKVCGGMVIRQEPGTGMISVRHTSIKAYSPLPKNKNAPLGPESPDAEEARRAVTRHIALQASECDRMSDKCTRHIYNDITRRLNSSLAL